MDWLRMTGPMWIVATGLVTSVAALARGGLSSDQRVWAIFFLAAFTLTMITVVMKWLNADGGVRDWSSGGVASITHDDARRLDWSDWALVTTRAGSIDVRRQRLRLETRIFLGLISWNRVDRLLNEFDSVQAIHHYVEAKDRDDRRTYVAYDHFVELHRADGQPIRLFDIVSGNSDDAAAKLVDRLAARINKVIRRA